MWPAAGPSSQVGGLGKRATFSQLIFTDVRDTTPDPGVTVVTKTSNSCPPRAVYTREECKESAFRYL